jgi:nicotinate-nucleotide--dimethylbenzimidazole phosphoribosyltransferase
MSNQPCENDFSNPVKPENHQIAQQAWAHLDRLTKPPRSLGRVEEIAVQLCSIQKITAPQSHPRSVLIFAGDHGVCEENISAFPQAVTGEMLKNMAGGGAAVSVLSKLHQVDLIVIDVGSMLPSDVTIENVERRVIRAGTRNFTKEAAMTDDEIRSAFDIGKEFIRHEADKNVKLVILGEMGIGNTTSASAISAAILQCPVADITGRGTGVDDEGIQRKISAIEKGLALHQPDPLNGLQIATRVGGYEIAAMAGAILEARDQNIAILLDGFIVTAAALVACSINPDCKFNLIASHSSAEHGHKQLLDFLRLKPLLQLNMRLGEASGALIALPIIDAATAIYHNMATFESAGVSNKKS